MIENYFLALLDWWRLMFVLWNKESNFFLKEGEIWWCTIGLNIGEEVYGKGSNFARPILIFKRLTKNSFLGLPFTGSEKKGSWYVPIDLPSRRSSIMLNQARIIDKKRLRSRIAVMSVVDFQLVKESFHEFYCSP
jgi:mRNA-degrading endonuclease toxin of MazEF toxin-antitoxin module